MNFLVDTSNRSNEIEIMEKPADQAAAADTPHDEMEILAKRSESFQLLPREGEADNTKSKETETLSKESAGVLSN